MVRPGRRGVFVGTLIDSGQLGTDGSEVQQEPIAGRYELVEPLAPGGMGQVWRGYDAVLDREVAVKLIRPDVVCSDEQAEEFAKRFRREARVTARIQHHGVPQVYDAVLDRSFDRVYLVMEYVHGTSLRAYISAEQPLPISWAVAVAAQICTVLSHAHAIPVVHRDLKPDNVLVTDSGAVKLLDFGIAAILRTDVTRLTVTGNPIGTSRYMPPEQIHGTKITPHSDLYALGCILHELLCGKPVFDGGSEFQLMQQHVYEAPQPLRQLRPDVPEAVERLVLQMLAKASEQRPADAYEVYEQLLPLLPPPRSDPAPGEAGPIGMPDPTMLYRRPNAPRARPETTSATPRSIGDVASGQPDGMLATGLRYAIGAAVSQSDGLLEEERFAQAAEVLQNVIAPASAALGPESHRVMKLRSRRAAILVIGGDYRRALPEFDALAAAYVRTAGPASPDGLECMREAAYCRAELGQASAALRQLREVLTRVRGAGSDVTPTALDLRHNIGVLLLAEGNAAEAATELDALHQDLLVLYGPKHEETQEVADLLTRLRLPKI